METNGKQKSKRAKARAITTTPRRTTKTELPLVQGIENCDFHGYDADILMKETAKLRKIITKRGIRNSNHVMLHYHFC
jgi:hypothetical protein